MHKYITNLISTQKFIKSWTKYWIFSQLMKLLSPPRTISLSLPLVDFGVLAQLLPATPASAFTALRDIKTMSLHFFSFQNNTHTCERGQFFRINRTLILTPCATRQGAFHIKVITKPKFKSRKEIRCFYFTWRTWLASSEGFFCARRLRASISWSSCCNEAHST